MLNWNVSKRLSCALLMLAPVLTGCLEKQVVASIPDAENILFTEDGRLLVTGGKDVYQLTRQTDASGNASYERRVASPVGLEGKCNYTGLAQQGDWVFTTCVELKWLIIRNNHLLAANLNADNFRFDYVVSPKDTKDPLDRAFIPNGMDFAPDGALLIADENFVATSGVDRAVLDIPSSAEWQDNPDVMPTLVSYEKDWLSASPYDVHSANGLKVEGQNLYITEGGKLKRFQFDAQGQIPATVQDANGNTINNTGTTLWQNSLAILDDLQPYCDGVAVSSFLSGRIHYIARYEDPATGREFFETIYSSPGFGFDNPSSLAVGAGEGFDGRRLLVTEKGILFNHNPSYGNVLVSVRLTENLDDPDVCLMIQEQARQQLAKRGEL